MHKNYGNFSYASLPEMYLLRSLKAEGAHTKWRFDIVNWKVERRKQKM